MTAYAALLAALTAVGAYIAIPIGPVPIVLQNLFVYLMGLLLGLRWGLAGIGVYLLAGAVGLPVFSGGRGGLGHLIGPTGGYLVGFVPAVAVVGFITEKTSGKLAYGILALILATTSITYVALVGASQDATIHQWQSMQATYAAEAGLEMAMQELAKAEDTDSDGTVGGISDDGNPGNNPSVCTWTFPITRSASR